MDFMIMMPLGPQLNRIFDLDPSDWSLVVSSYTYTAAISAFASIFVIDRFDRKKSLLFLYAGFILGTLGVGLSNTFETLLLTRSITGIFGGIINAVTLTIVGDLVPYEKRAAATGIIAAGFSAAAALGVPFGLYLGTVFWWQVPFLVIAGFSVLLWLYSYRAIPSITGHIDQEHPMKRWEGLTSILKDGNQLRALLLMMVLIGGHFMIVPWLSPYMVANVGFEEIELTYIYLLGGSLTIFTSPIIGRIADIYGKKRIFVLVLLISLIPIYFITNLGQTEVYLVLIITSIFFIFAGGRMAPVTAIVISTAPPRNRGGFMSIRASMQNLAAGIAAYASGLIVMEGGDGLYRNFDTVGLVSIFSGLATIIILRFVYPKY